MLVVAGSQAIGLVAAAALLIVTSEPMPTTSALDWAFLAGASGVVGLAAFYRGLARGAMGLVAPLSALIGAGLPALVGLVAGDELQPLHLAGIACALAAVVLTSRPARATAADARQLPLVLIAGLGFAGFFLAMDEANGLGAETWWPAVIARVAGLSLVALAALAVASGRFTAAGGRQDVPLRSMLPLFLLTGLGDLGGNAFFLLANAQGQLSVTAVLASLYPVATVALAWLFLGERLARSHLVGVALALVGVALIALARSS